MHNRPRSHNQLAMADHDFSDLNRPFLEWLDAELEERGWDDAELARRGNFYATSLTHLRKGRRKPGIKLVNSIANGLGISPGVAAAKAGLVPDYTVMANEKDEQDVQRIRRLFNQMDNETRDTFLAIGDSLARRDQRRRAQGETRARPRTARS